MRIDVLTLFPPMLDGFLSESMLGRAQEAKLLEIKVHNTRDWATDKHRTTDDRPFGGGAGMVMKCEPIFDAIEQLQTPGCRRIYLTPDGAPFTSARAEALAQEQHLIFLSGHYEGIDQRIRDTVIDEEISIGDYVLTNGTLLAVWRWSSRPHWPRFASPAMLGEEKSLTTESFTRNLLDFPNYTRPAVYRGMSVPEVLLQGNHGEIEKWRHAQQLEKTAKIRPDLLKKQP